MDEKKIIPNFIIVLGWLISLFAFTIGFWHAHLGMKEMRPLSSEYGSLVISGLILLLLIVAYNRAIAGAKAAIYFYLLCATFMFIFNLNSFYPTYLGKKLIKEDATELKDTLERYSTVLAKSTGIDLTSTFAKVAELENIKKTLLNEISGTTMNGRGPVFDRELNNFNNLASSNINMGTTPVILNDQQKITVSNDLSASLNTAIKNFVLKQSPNQKNGYLLVTSSFKMDSLNREYSPKLTAIQADTSTFNLDSVKTNPQITTMKELASAFDGISKPVNTALKKKLLPELDNSDNQVAIPQTQELGRIAHTISSIFKRINKIDTWGIIILCFFIDFVVPLGVFLLIKGNNSKDQFSIKFPEKGEPTKF